MAGDWIPMRISLAADPDVVAIATALNLPEDDITGKLLRFWGWADQHTTDGNASSVTTSWIDRYIGVTGFASALMSRGWLEETHGGVRIPGFERFLGKSGKTRAKTNRRVAAHREVKRNCNDASVTKSLPEKRREEKSINTSPPSKTDGVTATADEWARLESALTANGVREIASVRNWLRCSVAHALAAVRHYASKPGAWKPEHLVTRLKNLRDSQDPTDDSLWLPMEAAYVKRQRQAAAPKVPAGPDPGVESQKRLADLESRYGEELNAMSDVDRDALAVGLVGPMVKLYRTSGWKSVRPMLLELMKSRDGPTPPPTVKVHSPPTGDGNGSMAQRKGCGEPASESLGFVP